MPHSAKSLAGVLASAVLGSDLQCDRVRDEHRRRRPGTTASGAPGRQAEGNDARGGDDRVRGRAATTPSTPSRATTASWRGRRRAVGRVDGGRARPHLRQSRRGPARGQGRAGPPARQPRQRHPHRRRAARRRTVSQDRLFGGRGNDTLRGGDGTTASTAARETTRQRPGRQRVIRGSRARQSVGRSWPRRRLRRPGQRHDHGGAGNDILFALARRRRPGPRHDSGDTVAHGARTQLVRDGEQDTSTAATESTPRYLDFKDVIEYATPANPNGSCEAV